MHLHSGSPRVHSLLTFVWFILTGADLTGLLDMLVAYGFYLLQENGSKWTKGDGSVVDGFTIDQKAEEEILSFQVYHDCRGTDTFLGSTCFKLADLEAEHNGALFKKSVFQAKLIAPEKSSFFRKTPTKEELDEAAKFSINFLAEFVPDIQFADTPSLSPLEKVDR
jgi:hypothetical protein